MCPRRQKLVQFRQIYSRTVGINPWLCFTRWSSMRIKQLRQLTQVSPRRTTGANPRITPTSSIDFTRMELKDCSRKHRWKRSNSCRNLKHALFSPMFKVIGGHQKHRQPPWSHKRRSMRSCMQTQSSLTTRKCDQQPSMSRESSSCIHSRPSAPTLSLRTLLLQQQSVRHQCREASIIRRCETRCGTRCETRSCQQCKMHSGTEEA